MIYFGIALFCTGVFIVQFILSFILGEIDLDSDIDLDADGDVDFSLSDILSFKGLIHFGIGFGWTMWFSQDLNKLLAAGISIFVGLVFVFVLAGVYRLCMFFKNEGPQETDKDLVGRTSEIYFNGQENNLVILVEYNGCLVKKNAKSISGKKYNVSEKAQIVKFESGILWIG